MSTVLDVTSTLMLELNVALEKIIGHAEDVSLKMLPDSKFYRE